MADGVRQRKKGEADAGIDAPDAGSDDRKEDSLHPLQLLCLLLAALCVAVVAAGAVRFGPSVLGLTPALTDAEYNAAAAAANAAVAADVAATAPAEGTADVAAAEPAPPTPHLDLPLMMEDGSLLLTKAQLAQYDGTFPERPVYLGMLGKVFDVSAGHFYRPGGGYDFFAGKDGTRGFVTGDFTEDGLDDDVESLEPKQMLDVEHWIDFYRDHEEYTYVGKVIGRYYSDSGKELKALHKAMAKLAQGKSMQNKADDLKKEYPSCNSKWSQKEGGKVWCNDKLLKVRSPESKLVPRKMTDPDSGVTRCACVELHRAPGLVTMALYDNCAADSETCLN